MKSFLFYKMAQFIFKFPITHGCARDMDETRSLVFRSQTWMLCFTQTFQALQFYIKYENWLEASFLRHSFLRSKTLGPCLRHVSSISFPSIHIKHLKGYNFTKDFKGTHECLKDSHLLTFYSKVKIWWNCILSVIQLTGRFLFKLEIW